MYAPVRMPHPLQDPPNPPLKHIISKRQQSKQFLRVLLGSASKVAVVVRDATVKINRGGLGSATAVSTRCGEGVSLYIVVAARSREAPASAHTNCGKEREDSGSKEIREVHCRSERRERDR